MLKEFKAFALKGNILDLAIGVIIGGAFGKIITSLVNDMIMPLLSLLTGNINFQNHFYALDGKKYATIELAKAAKTATINYGLFITAVIDFLIVAFTIFIVVKQLSRFKKKEEPKVSKVKDCPYCKTNIAAEATRCPNCTSQL
ncbi:MAG: large conductance mechanosensitive channel protein MscL [Clostridiaceae bacterium]|nr:large conductance mechanosensitive channel protein MscL [Clostridiaceae bacterium]